MTIVQKFVNLLAVSCLAMLAACNNTPATGAAAVKVVFRAPSHDATLRGLLTGIVDSIRVEVRDDSGPLVQKAFTYDDLQGTVDAIPAGDGRDFLVEALSAEVVVYRGTALDVTIVAGDTVDVEVVLSSAYTEDVYPPAPVADLSAKPQGADLVLAWSASGDDGMVGRAGSYDVRWSAATIQASNFDAATTIAGAPIPSIAGQEETLTVTGLSPDIAYHFALRVIDDDGNVSGVSNEAIATVGSSDLTSPDAIGDLSVGSFDDSSVTLGWTAPGDDGAQGMVAGYDVRYSTSDITAQNFDQALAAHGPSSLVAPGQNQTVTVSGLSDGQQYYFAVKAADEVPNWSDLSNIVDATPADVIGPDAVNLTVDAVDDTSVTLGWLAPGDDGSVGTAQSYEIRYSTGTIDAGSFSSATLWGFPPEPMEARTAQSVLIFGLETATQYSFALISNDDAGNPSALSNVVFATPGEQDDLAPADVDDLSVESVADMSVTLTWTAPGDDGSGGNPVSAYDVRYSQVAIDDVSFDSATPFVWPGGTSIVAAGQTQTLEIDGLDQEQTYFFALKARDEFANWSGVSNAPSATTVDQTAPSDTVDLQLSDFGDDYVTFQWTAPGDDGTVGTASAYEIYYSDSAFDDYSAATSWGTVPIPQIAGTSQSATIDGLVPGTEVFVRLRASDEVPNWSGLSNQLSQVLSCSACPNITSIRPSSAPVGSVVYLDGANFGATPGASTVSFAGVNASVTTWSDSRLVVIVPAVSGGVDAAVQVTTSVGVASSVFTARPYIDSLTPDSLSPPGTVMITGSGFADAQGTSTIEIVGSAEQPAVVSWTDTGISMDIPAGATTGPVRILVGAHSSNTPILTVAPLAWSAPSDVVDATNPSLTPRISADRLDNLQLLWVETDGTNMQVFAKHGVLSGWSSSALDLSGSGVDSSSPTIVNMGSTQFLVGWLDGSALSASLGFGATFSSVDGLTAGPALAPCVATLPDGQALMAWAAGDGQSVLFSLRDGAGQWSASSQVFGTAGNTTHIGCTRDAAGFVHVVLADGSSVVHSIFDGVSWSGPEVLGAITGDPSLAKFSVAADLKGRLFVVWWDAGLYYSSSNVGALWSNPAGIASVASTTSARPVALTDSAGVVNLAVEDDQGNERAVLHLSMLADGAWSVPVEVSTAGDAIDATGPDMAEGGLMSIYIVWSEGDYIYISSQN